MATSALTRRAPWLVAAPMPRCAGDDGDLAIEIDRRAINGHRAYPSGRDGRRSTIVRSPARMAYRVCLPRVSRHHDQETAIPVDMASTPTTATLTVGATGRGGKQLRHGRDPSTIRAPSSTNFSAVPGGAREPEPALSNLVSRSFDGVVEDHDPGVAARAQPLSYAKRAFPPKGPTALRSTWPSARRDRHGRA